MKFIGVKLPGACWNMAFKMRLLHLALTTMNKEEQSLAGLFGFWRQHLLHWIMLLQPLYQVIHKATSFEWGSAASLKCSSCSAAWGLRPSRPSGMEVSVAEEKLCGEPLPKTPIGESVQTLRGLKYNYTLFCWLVSI